MGSAKTLDLRYADEEAEVVRCFELMRQLRPHLASEQEFIDRWRSQYQGPGTG